MCFGGAAPSVPDNPAGWVGTCQHLCIASVVSAMSEAISATPAWCTCCCSCVSSQAAVGPPAARQQSPNSCSELSELYKEQRHLYTKRTACWGPSCIPPGAQGALRGERARERKRERERERERATDDVKVHSTLHLFQDQAGCEGCVQGYFCNLLRMPCAGRSLVGSAC